MSGTARIGLVLAGGGAKGAYQAGVVRYLAEAEIEIAAVAGTSIGALNGAVVAAAPTVAVAADRLAAVWREIEGVTGREPAVLPPSAITLPGITRPGTAPPATLADVLAMARSPVLRPGFVDDMIARHVDPVTLGAGRPFWVTAFPAVRPGADRPHGDWLLDVARSAAGTASAWLRVDHLPAHERHAAVLASAALPFLAPGRWVAGTFYRDGGLGGIAANTPAGPLVRHGGLDLVLVTQLTRGVLWDAHDHPGAPILEIRPSEALSAPGVLGTAAGLLDFSPARLRRLRRQGYADARRGIETAAGLLGSVHARRESQDLMLDAVAQLGELPDD